MSASALASSSATSALEAGPAVDEQRLGLVVGLGEQAGPLGLDVALRLADLAASASASRRRPASASSSSSWIRCGAGRHRLLDDRAGLPEQQREDDDRGDAAEMIS